MAKSKSLFGEDTVEIVAEEVKKKSKNDLFGMIKLMFEDPRKFKDISSHEKGKHFFMINRFFSMAFPIQAQAFNTLKINPGDAVQVWATSIGPLYKTTPPFIWNTLKKTKKAKKEKKRHTLEDSTLLFFANKHMMSVADLEKAIDILGKPFIDELKLIEKARSKKFK